MMKQNNPVPLTSGETEEMEGVVESVIFHSDETGYTVCSIRLPEKKNTVTVVGKCPVIWTGEHLRARGKWAVHRNHGHQFQAETITCVPPTSAKGIERYLASGMIKGIGKVHAAKIVKVFGKDTLRIIEKESKRLEEVDGIGSGRRRMIKESWDAQHSVRDIMIFLQTHGIGTALSARIYRHYGDNAIAIITDNPYRLCEEVWGIGFKTADKVATSLGIPHESNIRARAGMVYVMQCVVDEGHCFCPVPELMLKAEQLLGIPVEVLADALAHETARGTLVKEDNVIYPSSVFESETSVAREIGRLSKTMSQHRAIESEKAIEWAQSRMHVEFETLQISALRLCLMEKIAIITGGPGVGKTTIIKAIVEIFSKRKMKVLMAAPTGRAAKRMEDATGVPAKTIHRLLKFVPRLNRFTHDASNRLEGDVFILDEVSMIDINLMRNFLEAIPDGSRLILVGDTDQLPSVGPGNVLRDMIESGTVKCQELKKIFRQESGGQIIRNAHLINEGERLNLSRTEEDSDFYFIDAYQPDDVISKMLELVTKRIPAKFGFDPMTEIQVLTPMRKNILGADNLNIILQNTLNPSGESVQNFGRKYRAGDRVMQIRNNYDKDVFNGDIGIIHSLDTEERALRIDFDGRYVKYDFADLDELVHAYACSIHKAQGCEYPAVVILMTTQHFKLLQRNLLYTAITRGRKLVCLVGSTKAIYMAVKNNEIRLRRTRLKDRLKAQMSHRDDENVTI